MLNIPLYKWGTSVKRYVLYNKKTGEILHSHRSYRFGSDEPVEVPEEKIKKIASRIVDPEKIKVMITDEPFKSSYNFARKVDIKSGKITTTKLPPYFWVKKARRKRRLRGAPVGGK